MLLCIRIKLKSFLFCTKWLESDLKKWMMMLVFVFENRLQFISNFGFTSLFCMFKKTGIMQNVKIKGGTTGKDNLNSNMNNNKSPG